MRKGLWILASTLLVLSMSSAAFAVQRTVMVELFSNTS